MTAIPTVLTFERKYSPKGSPIKSASKNQCPLFGVVVTNSTQKDAQALFLESAIKTGSVPGIQGVMAVLFISQ